MEGTYCIYEPHNIIFSIKEKRKFKQHSKNTQLEKGNQRLSSNYSLEDDDSI